MDEPQSMYLRGFTGAEFDGESWKPLEKEVLAKNKQLHYWMNLNAFDQNAQFDAAAAYAGLEQSTVTVQNIGACSFYRYVPFSIGKGTWADPENLNTDGVYAAGERSYVYSVNGGSTDDILQVLTHLQTSDTPAVLQYRKTESSYRQFIKDYYLQVPEEVRELLQKQWDEIAGKYGDAKNLTLQQAQECTLIFLGQCFPEEGTPEGIELPLKKAEGTSFQYATVAAMTLRYFGIPARYAEGYVISEEMAGNFGGGETISVDSSCAKAWVEVYQDGIGWIPMNLTPGIGDVLQNQKNDNENSSAGMDITEKQDDEEQEEQERPEPSGGSQVTVVVQTVMKGILVIVAVLLLILLILWIRRKILLNRKEKKFRSGNISDAVAWIYADTALILEKLGFSRGNGSMRTLQKPLEERYGAEFASRFAEVSALNDRAMFSGRAMEEEQRTAALGFRDLVIQKLRSEMKWYKRMWLRWARCLY